MRRRRVLPAGVKLADCAECGWTYELADLVPQGATTGSAAGDPSTPNLGNLGNNTDYSTVATGLVCPRCKNQSR
jgi:rubredoxin